MTPEDRKRERDRLEQQIRREALRQLQTAHTKEFRSIRDRVRKEMKGKK